MEEQPDRLPILHRRASEWYEHNGSPADAIHHALVAEDFELGGLPKESIVRPDKVFTLNESLIVRRFGKLTSLGLSRVLAAVCQELGCLEP